MKKFLILILSAVFLFSYKLKNITTCESVKNLTPINPKKIFYLTKDKRVYLFLHFLEIKKPFTIKLIWQKKENDKWIIINTYKLPIKAYSRWRTFAYITLRQTSLGLWRVKVIDLSNNKVIKNIYFGVEKEKKSIKI